MKDRKLKGGLLNIYFFQKVLLRSKGCQSLLQVPLMDWEIVNVYGTRAERTRPTKGNQREKEMFEQGKN